MNGNWIIVLIIWSLGLLGGGFEAGRWQAGLAAAKHDEEQQAATIAAENKVIKTERKANTITREVSNAYKTKISAIDSQYAAALDGVRGESATSNGMPGIPQPAGGTIAARDRKTSKQYGLTFQQCDIEEQKLIDFWEWANREKDLAASQD